MFGWIKKRRLLDRIADLGGKIELEFLLRRPDVDLSPVSKYGCAESYGYASKASVICDKADAIRLINDFYGKNNWDLRKVAKRIKLYEPKYYYAIGYERSQPAL